MNSPLSSNDYNILQNLIKCTNDIYTVYQDLGSLELINEKNTEMHNQLKIKLHNLLVEEKDIYDSFGLYEIKYTVLLNYLEDKLNSKKSLKTNSVTFLYENAVLYRIITTLNSKRIGINNRFQNMETKTNNNYYALANEDNDVETVKKVYKRLEESFNSDILMSYLSFVDEKINDESFNDIKKVLVNNKYCNIFINSPIERELIDSNFDVDKDVFCRSYLISQLNGVSKETFESIKSNYYYNRAARHISLILENKNASKSSKVQEECMLRALLIGIKNDLLSDLNFDFHEFIESKDYLKNNVDNEENEEIVVRSFKNFKKDRTRVKKIIIANKNTNH